MSAQICQACGAQISQGVKFCPNCGKEIIAQVCQVCGAQVTKGARFCQKCGNEIGARLCQHCGAKLNEGARFCPNCGKEAVPPTTSGMQSTSPVPSAKKSSLLHPSFGLRLVSGFVIIAIILFFWLGLPLIQNGDPDTSDDTTTTTTTSDETTTTTSDETTTTTMFAKAPWPDVPLYPGAKTVKGDFADMIESYASATAGMTMEWHFYQIGDNDFTSAISFYKSNLPKTGWQYLTDSSDPSSSSASAVFMKGTEMLVVMTINDPNISAGCILGLCRGKT